MERTKDKKLGLLLQKGSWRLKNKKNCGTVYGNNVVMKGKKITRSSNEGSWGNALGRGTSCAKLMPLRRVCKEPTDRLPSAKWSVLRTCIQATLYELNRSCFGIYMYIKQQIMKKEDKNLKKSREG